MARSAKPARLRRQGESITIKGTRNGLLFTLADGVPFPELLRELQERLAGDHPEWISSSPLTVYVELGDRVLAEDEEKALRRVFATHGNVIVGGFAGLPPAPQDTRRRDPYVYKGTLRSGQVIEHDGDVVVIGDVNPGAQIIASGDVYVMGNLRGSASAGAAGDRDAVVAATYFSPLQVKIADVARRSPESHARAAEMEFAYLEKDNMAVERMSYLAQHRLRRPGNRDGGQAGGIHSG
jgi:septum site-determining protein MinC